MKLPLFAIFVLITSATAQVPEFVHGDECLFCHRNDIGPAWGKNAHGVTMRQREDAPALVEILQSNPKLASIAGEVTHTLGSRNHVRFLKKSGYGKVDILSTRADLDKTGKVVHWENDAKPVWEKDKFAKQCAGCHATAVDPENNAFSEVGIDCYTCHGVVDLQHTNDTSKIFLSKKRRNDAIAIENTCAQCHLRGGKSKITGLPYPTNYTAGQDLLKNYEADFAKVDDTSMNAGDRHVWENVRDVLKNSGETTCINCHRVHITSSDKHRRVLTSAICQECHNAEGPKKVVKTYTVHSTLCEY
jgi:cytochrome c554/c'-like protein